MKRLRVFKHLTSNRINLRFREVLGRALFRLEALKKRG
jgi:hypothetical protein